MTVQDISDNLPTFKERYTYEYDLQESKDLKDHQTLSLVNQALQRHEMRKLHCTKNIGIDQFI